MMICGSESVDRTRVLDSIMTSWSEFEACWKKYKACLKGLKSLKKDVLFHGHLTFNYCRIFFERHLVNIFQKAFSRISKIGFTHKELRSIV